MITNKNLFGVMVAFAIVVQSLSCQAATRLLQSHELETDKDQFQNQKPVTNTNLKQTIPIHLTAGSFDPLSENSPTTFPHDLILQNYAENENGYYILQFRGPERRQWKDEVVSAGVSFFDYMPNDPEARILLKITLRCSK